MLRCQGKGCFSEKGKRFHIPDMRMVPGDAPGSGAVQPLGQSVERATETLRLQQGDPFSDSLTCSSGVSPLTGGYLPLNCSFCPVSLRLRRSNAATDIPRPGSSASSGRRSRQSRESSPGRPPKPPPMGRSGGRHPDRIRALRGEVPTKARVVLTEGISLPAGGAGFRRAPPGLLGSFMALHGRAAPGCWRPGRIAESAPRGGREGNGKRPMAQSFLGLPMPCASTPAPSRTGRQCRCAPGGRGRRHAEEVRPFPVREAAAVNPSGSGTAESVLEGEHHRADVVSMELPEPDSFLPSSGAGRGWRNRMQMKKDPAGSARFPLWQEGEIQKEPGTLRPVPGKETCPAKRFPLRRAPHYTSAIRNSTSERKLGSGRAD